MLTFLSGKSESITIKNEKGRLSPEEIERMVAEAERFAADDEAQRKRIEALNALSSFVYSLKTQLGDNDGLGGKINEDDKKTILSTIKETTDWIDENGSSAGTEEFEEKLAGKGFHSSSIPNLFTCVQRYKASSIQLRVNCTRQMRRILLVMTKMSYVATMNCKGPKKSVNDLKRKSDAWKDEFCGGCNRSSLSNINLLYVHPLRHDNTHHPIPPYIIKLYNVITVMLLHYALAFYLAHEHTLYLVCSLHVHTPFPSSNSRPGPFISNECTSLMKFGS